VGLTKSIEQSNAIVNGHIALIFPNGNRHVLAKSQYSLDDTDELLKAQTLAPGQRWITVHSHGEGKGTPILVQEAEHGSGVYHVIGGAGGKLNYLKLHGIKPESSYKEHAADRSKAKRDKELGLDKAKGKAREAVKSQTRQAREKFIQAVAKTQGWKAEDLQPNLPDNVSEVTRNKLAQRHHSALLAKAHEAVNLQRLNLATDAMAREEAGGVAADANEHTPDSQLNVADLDGARPQGKSGLGFSAHYAERAEEKGASEAVIKQEAGEQKEARQAHRSDAQKAAIKRRGTVQAQIKAETESLREPVTANVKAVLTAASEAVALIKAQNELKAVHKAAKTANKDIDRATEVKAWNMEVSAPEEGAVEEDLTHDLRTLRTTAFLSAVKAEVGDHEKALRQHVGAGAFNSINGLALAGGGNALVDRSVVDVLGIAGAASVLARRLHADLSPERVAELTEGMGEYHLHHHMETAKNAMAEAQELHAAAKEIRLGEARHGDDFEAARELGQRRKACVEQAHKILGTALGEMEANAALVTALKEGRSHKPLEVPLGKIADEDAIRQVRAIGLQRGDYRIDRVAGNQILTVTPEGLDRLAKPVDREEMARTQGTLAILKGGQDEDNWLPQGFAARHDLALDLKPGVSPSLAQKFDPSGGDLQQALKDYIGGRTADGDSPNDIICDIQSESFQKKAGDADAYQEAIDAVVPRKDKDGKALRNEDLAAPFNEMADSFAERKLGGKISPLQRQNFEPGEVEQDALHRALADEPAGIAAYKPIGELTGDDQRTLRQFFNAHVAHESEDHAVLRERLAQMEATKPDQHMPGTTPEWIAWNDKAKGIASRLEKAEDPAEVESIKAEQKAHSLLDPAADDVFSSQGETPEFRDYEAQHKQLKADVKSSKLDWQKYASAMHGHENAYAAMQDLIRSSVAKSFQEHHNKLMPDAPLKLGRQVIRNNLHHLDILDPAARQVRQNEEKARGNDGRYSSETASREEKEAAKQSQMGFFSTEQEDMFGGGGDAPKAETPLKADERYTLGHAAERTIGGMMGVVGQNFKPGRPLKIFNPTMSGPDGIMRQRAIKIIAQNKRVALAAGTGCVRGDTILDDAEGRKWTFAEWWISGERPTVLSLTKDGTVTERLASPVFSKGKAVCRHVILSNGTSLVVSENHLFLTQRGWVRAFELRGDDRCASLSAGQKDAFHPEGSETNYGRQYQGKALGYPTNCSPCSRQYGESLLLASSNDQETIPLLGGAHTHILPHLQKDDPAYVYKHTQTCGHIDHLSSGTIDSLSDQWGLVGQQPLVDVNVAKLLLDLRQENWIFQSRFDSLRYISEQFQESLLTNSCAHTLLESSLSQPLLNNSEQNQHKYQALSPLQMHFEDEGMLELQHQGEVLAGVPCVFIPIVSNNVCGKYIIFDVNVPIDANYLANGIIHHNSGKSAMMIGAFSHLKSHGKTKRGLILCPSIVQSQIGDEALRFLKPSAFNWHCEPGASRDERLAAHKDGKHDFTVMTHQSFRDDMLHLGAQHAGITPEAMAERLGAMKPEGRAEWMKELMNTENINYDFLSVDEGHNILNRDGKENSGMANVVDSVSANTEYYVSATADLVKNDISEAYSVLQKMAPERYKDKGAFMRRYGVGSFPTVARCCAGTSR
jgi:hypothetical protein